MEIKLQWLKYSTLPYSYSLFFLFLRTISWWTKCKSTIFSKTRSCAHLKGFEKAFKGAKYNFFFKGTQIINENCLPRTSAENSKGGQNQSRRKRSVFSDVEENLQEEEFDICQLEKCSRRSLLIRVNVSLSDKLYHDSFNQL